MSTRREGRSDKQLYRNSKCFSIQINNLQQLTATYQRIKQLLQEACMSTRTSIPNSCRHAKQR